MTDHVLNDIHATLRKGGRLAVGRNYYGGIRLKVISGPFGLFQRRLNISQDDLQRLFATIKLKSVAV